MRVDVFVSSENITTSPAADLVRALRERGLSVSHSPPWDEEAGWSGPWNTDWDSWYGPNLRRSMEGARLIVIVISPLWEASSWMLAECEAALNANARVGYTKTLVWNAGAIPVTDRKRAQLLGEALPRSLDEAAEVLVARLQDLPME